MLHSYIFFLFAFFSSCVSFIFYLLLFLRMSIIRRWGGEWSWSNHHNFPQFSFTYIVSPKGFQRLLQSWYLTWHWHVDSSKSMSQLGGNQEYRRNPCWRDRAGGNSPGLRDQPQPSRLKRPQQRASNGHYWEVQTSRQDSAPENLTRYSIVYYREVPANPPRHGRVPSEDMGWDKCRIWEQTPRKTRGC